jgi:hypothetical protein
MGSLVGWGVAALLLLWLLTRGSSKKPEVSKNGAIGGPQGPQYLEPGDMRIPASLLHQLGADVINEAIRKKVARGAAGGTEGGARGPEEDEMPALPPEH